jgi:hypothetical protein
MKIYSVKGIIIPNSRGTMLNWRLWLMPVTGSWFPDIAARFPFPLMSATGKRFPAACAAIRV